MWEETGSIPVVGTMLGIAETKLVLTPANKNPMDAPDIFREMLGMTSDQTALQNVEICRIEIRHESFCQEQNLDFEYQVRAQDGGTPILGSAEEALRHFYGDNGYRVSFPLGNWYDSYLSITLWRNPAE